MKTITKTYSLYEFDELSEQAKQKAIEDYRNNGIDTQYNYDEAYESVKKFHEVFGTEEGRNSWSDARTSHIDDNLMNLKGLRLRTYILNHFYDDLYSGKYYNSWGTEKPVRHTKVKSKQMTKETGWSRPENWGKYWNIYEGLNKDHCCEFTGVCWDESLLQPMYEFIEWKLRPDYNKDMDFETLVNDCFESLRKSLENEDEYRNSDEAIIEAIRNNDYEFLEDGSME